MAQNYLQDHDWIDANWSTGTKPAANGEAYIPESLATDVDSSLDQGLIDLNLLWISAGYKHNIGSASSALKIASDAVIHYGTGGLFYDCSLGAGAALITDLVVVACANNSGTAQFDSEAGDLGTYLDMKFLRGQVTLKGTTKWEAAATVEVGHIADPLSDMSLTMETNANTLATFNQVSGKTESKVTITTATVSGGNFKQDGKAITTLNVEGGANGVGNVIYKHTALTTVNVRAGGVLDLTQFFNDDLTIGLINLWPGGTVYGTFDRGGAQVWGPTTVTKWNDMGGTILPHNPNIGRAA